MKGSVNWGDHLLNFLSVIAGVTLAFLISNWAEYSRIRKTFKQNISAIYDEIENDVYTFESYQIPDNREKLVQMQAVVAALASGEEIDSIEYFMEAFFSINNYSPSNTALNSLATSGKLDLIPDPQIKSELLSYRDLSLELQKQGEVQVEYLLEKLFPWFIERPDLMLGDAAKIGSLDTYSKKQAILLMSFYVSLVEGKIEKYEYALNQGKGIQSVLEGYLTE